MPLSPIPPFAPHPVLTPTLALSSSASVANTFTNTLTNTLKGLPNLRVVQAPTSQPQPPASLEQALFNQWLSSLQSSISAPLGPGLQTALGSTLSITRTSQPAFDPSNPQSLLLGARLIALFNTFDLLCADTAAASQPGSLLDTLA